MMTTASHPSIYRLSLNLSGLVKMMRRRRKADPDAAGTELTRLLETSPHLLRDIGFRQELDGSWSNAERRIPTDHRKLPDIYRA